VALEKITGKPPVKVWHGDSDFPKVDLIAVPGGFSFGDYLRAGAMAARSPVMREVIARANQGVPVVGVCNGFQILTEAGLLPGALMRNAGLKFVCRDIWLKVENNRSIFTNRYAQGQVIRIPIAHHDGNYFADAETLDRLENENRIAFRYCDASGNATDDANPNGSQRNIAGILNERGNVLGMMPHPERLIEPELGGCDGRIFFESLVEALH
jgi:phosphoribosylformylglycinamidine synthase I